MADTETLADKAKKIGEDVAYMWGKLQNSGCMIPHKLNTVNMQDVIEQITSVNKWNAKGLFLYNYTGAFYDFYTKHEVDDMTELPEPPEGATGWPMTLQEIKTALETNSYIVMLASGAFTADLSVEYKLTSSSYLTPHIAFYVTGNPEDVVVRWGDGATSFAQSVGRNYLSHTYSETGNYLVTISINGNATTVLIGQVEGIGEPAYSLFFNTSSTSDTAYRSYIGEVYVGDKIALGAYALTGGYVNGSSDWNMSSFDTLSMPSFPSVVPKYFLSCNGSTEFVIPQNTVLGEYMFYRSRKLEVAQLPASATSIPRSAFAECSALENINLDNVIEVGSDAFNQCTNLTNVGDTSKITKVNNTAFASCKKLAGFITNDFLNQLTSIANSAFSSCSSEVTSELGTVEFTIERDGTGYDTGAFQYMNTLKKVDASLCSKNFSMNGNEYLEEYVPSSTATTFQSQQFRQCNRLKSVVVPEGVTELPQMFMYYSCRETASDEVEITLPSTLTKLGMYAFGTFGSNTCQAELNIPASVTTIESYVFQSCNAKKITFEGQLPDLSSSAYGAFSLYGTAAHPITVDFSNCTTIPTIAANTVSMNSSVTVILPDDLYDDWIVAPVWSTVQCNYVKASEV